LNTNIIKEYEILLGSLEEQDEIADILSTWDRAIELKEKLLEQKKLQKKGLMERLLTGKVRMLGFQRPWKKVKLEELFVERKEIGRSDLELLSITASKGVVRHDELVKVDTSSEDKSKYKRITPNDIGYNTMRMWQGVSGVSQYEGIVSPAYTVVTPKKDIDVTYMAYLFKLPKTVHDFWRFSQGLVDDTLNLKFENFRQISVAIPTDYLEQRKIAEILRNSDHEIIILEKEIEQLQLQKKGLMQLLLTGKVRVVS
jgi:type I restriction enzyme S subunit